MVIASIDLMKGKAVQLRQGREKILERHDPVTLAREFDRFGEIAVIDLDAAMGEGDNFQVIKDIIKIGECRVGGGIRTIEQARKLISLGSRKIIIGSAAFLHDQINVGFLRRLEKAIGRDQIIIAVDAYDQEIVIRAWTHRTGLPLLSTVPILESYCNEFLFTCVQREGCMEGIDMELVETIRKTTAKRLTVAGGIRSYEEIRKCSRLGCDVQLGMALYTGRIDLGEAFVESLNWANKLIPTITQDARGRVLMLAYSNRDSIRQAFKTGKMHYYSRSRQELWFKGKGSGNFQGLIRMRTDCDQDALLATVNQTGFACHRGSYSCFH